MSRVSGVVRISVVIGFWFRFWLVWSEFVGVMSREDSLKGLTEDRKLGRGRVRMGEGRSDGWGAEGRVRRTERWRLKVRILVLLRV